MEEPREIIGIIYTNAYQTLFYATRGYGYVFEERGYRWRIIDMADPGGYGQLCERLQSGEVVFGFGMQGVGSRIEQDGRNIWLRHRVPFLNLHFDPVSSNIYNHFCDSPFVANMYHFNSQLETQRRYVQSPQISGHLPFEVFHHLPPQFRDGFRQRPIKMLFMKSGENLGECRETFDRMPAPLRDSVYQQLEVLQRDPDLSVADKVQEIFDQAGFGRDTHFDLFWGVAHWMDLYLRRKRAIDFVNWLKGQEGAVILGDGWDFIDRDGARAEFKSSVDFADTIDLYRQTQFMCNVNPYGRDIIHERTVFGSIHGCCLISDANVWWRQHFGDVAAVKLFEWSKPLADQVEPFIHDAAAIDHAIEADVICWRGMEKFTNLGWVDKALAQVERVRELTATGRVAQAG